MRAEGDFIINEAFVAYSLPGTTAFLYCTVAKVHRAKDLSHLLDYDFVFSPFDKENHDSIFVKFSSKANGRKFSVYPSGTSIYESTSYQDYIQGFEKIQAHIKKGTSSKLILSKLIKLEHRDPNLYDLFISLKNSNSKAFTYLVHLPGWGTWMGSSPETLLKKTSEGYITKAVAGTRKKAMSNIPWGEKEIEEHRLVEQYIGSKLDAGSCSYSKSDSITINAGNVDHISSSFVIKENVALDYLIDILHPNPALGGYPKEVAVKLLRDIEKHDRSYYTGFLGVIDANSVSLFANIRCLQAFRDYVVLYVGGGITKDSDPNLEWQETEDKAQVIIAHIEPSLSKVETE